ncbi:MAG: hypothetical protein ABFQ89_06380 [Chloroflexota bacterium]
MNHFVRGQLLFHDGQPVVGVKVSAYHLKSKAHLLRNSESIWTGLTDAHGRFKLHRLEDDERITALTDPREILWTESPNAIESSADRFQIAFDVPVAGRGRIRALPLNSDSHTYHLHLNRAVTFLPSRHAWGFINRFPGYYLPFAIRWMPDIPSVRSFYGLCGGMVASSLDWYYAGEAIPEGNKAPRRKSTIHQYLHKRQMHSIGKVGRQVVRFAHWMALPDGTGRGTWARTWLQFKQVRKLIDQGQPVPLGLVYVSSHDTLGVWHNHQVLAYRYVVRSNDLFDLYIYDPNHPRRDDVFIRCHKVRLMRETRNRGSRDVTGLRGEQRVGYRRKKTVRGFFVMPYERTKVSISDMAGKLGQASQPLPTLR